MTMLRGLIRTRPGQGPPRLRISTDDPVALSGRLHREVDRSLIAGTGWNLRRGQVLVVPQAAVELGKVVRHLAEFGITGKNVE
jgi:hypothetical protein